jgi:HAD superfamily hydrolase (TIGR01549 family)
MPVEAVLFDLFDTLLLLESDEVYYEPCLRKMHTFLAKNGVDVPFDIFNHTYFAVRDKFYSESRESLEEPHFNVRVSQTLRKLGYNFDVFDPVVVGATTAFAEEFTRYVRLDNDAIGVLQKLRGRYKLGLVSNFGIPECGKELLEKFGLKEYLDVVVISGEVNRRKPSPEIFEKALRALRVPASKAVFVGDMIELDVKGPKSVGIRAILIERRPMEKDVSVRPDEVIKNLAELPAILESC